MKLWDRFVARRHRKARERYLAERRREAAAGWETDPRRAMDNASSVIGSSLPPHDQSGSLSGPN